MQFDCNLLCLIKCVIPSGIKHRTNVCKTNLIEGKKKFDLSLFLLLRLIKSNLFPRLKTYNKSPLYVHSFQPQNSIKTQTKFNNHYLHMCIQNPPNESNNPVTNKMSYPCYWCGIFFWCCSLLLQCSFWLASVYA